MDDLNPMQWAAIALLVAMYLLTCLRVAGHAGRQGRSVARWFVITMFLTAVPAMIVLSRRRKAPAADDGRLATGPLQPRLHDGRMYHCPRCRKLVTLDGNDASGTGVCPRCGQSVDEVHVA